MSKGFLIYAKGDEYIKQAYLCTLSIKTSKNSYPVTLVTDTGVLYTGSVVLG